MFTDRDGKSQPMSLSEKLARSAVAHDRFHAHRRGASHVRREVRKAEWLQTDADREYLLSLIAGPVYQPGAFANNIAPPRRGINRQPINVEYVRTETSGGEPNTRERSVEVVIR